MFTTTYMVLIMSDDTLPVNTMPTPVYGLTIPKRWVLTNIISEAKVPALQTRESCDKFANEVKVVIKKLHYYIWAVTPTKNRTATDNKEMVKALDTIKNLSLENRILFDGIIGVDTANRLRDYNIDNDMNADASTRQTDRQYLINAVSQLCIDYGVKFESGKKSTSSKLMKLIAESAGMELNDTAIKNLIVNFNKK